MRQPSPAGTAIDLGPDALTAAEADNLDNEAPEEAVLGSPDPLILAGKAQDKLGSIAVPLGLVSQVQPYATGLYALYRLGYGIARTANSSYPHPAHRPSIPADAQGARTTRRCRHLWQWAAACCRPRLLSAFCALDLRQMTSVLRRLLRLLRSSGLPLGSVSCIRTCCSTCSAHKTSCRGPGRFAWWVQLRYATRR